MQTATKEKKPKQATIEPGKAEVLPINKIDFNPLNYRKYFRQEDLETFAAELKLHGIISPLTVRKLPKGRYELVAGERRLKAAKIARLQTVPVIVRDLTDEQVIEIQLAENLQRENPHPMDEAQAVKLMQDTGKNIEEISLRLGKSKQFVYARLKLLNLIDSFREMSYADIITIQQALEIATISQDGQTEFYNDHCTKWKQKDFKLHNLDYYLRPYKYDLRNAPFDTKDKKLIPEVGACTRCPFNSATLKSLFPDYAKQAICTNTSCYMNKCTAGLRNGILNELQIHQSVALIFNGEASEKMLEFLKQIPEAESLTRHDYNKITIFQKPEEPGKEDFTFENDDEEEEFDKKAFNSAMQEYKAELSEYEKDIKSGKFKKGLLEKGGNFYPVWFNLDPPRRNDYSGNGRGVTMKSVQEAIKAGTATSDLLESAVEGIKQREQRAKELDIEKIQKTVHAEFSEKCCDPAKITLLTETDLVAARLLVYQSLDFSSRQKVDEVLFGHLKGRGRQHSENFYEILKELSDQQYSYLIRTALAGKSDSKYPNNESGVILYKVAEAAGVDVRKIEANQQGKATARADRVKERLRDLNKRKTKLKGSSK